MGLGGEVVLQIQHGESVLGRVAEVLFGRQSVDVVAQVFEHLGVKAGRGAPPVLIGYDVVLGHGAFTMKTCGPNGVMNCLTSAIWSA